jgi:hypothetical protein
MAADLVAASSHECASDSGTPLLSLAAGYAGPPITKRAPYGPAERRCSLEERPAAIARELLNVAHSGPEIPPSFRMRQKWIAIKNPVASGSATTCST